MRKARRKT